MIDRFKPKIALARRLRKTMTEPEVLLWQRLRSRDGGLVFRRQKPLGPYILDFYCFAASLVIEVDGALHDFDYDERRDDYLRQLGLHIHRIPATEVYRNADAVADGIRLLAADLIASKG